jgi:hypothetical protein
MFGEAVIGDAEDVDVFNGEPLALRRRNASEYGSLVRAAPAVVTNNEVVFGDELQGLPLQIPDGARDALDRLTKLVEPDLGVSVRLMVRNVRMNQTLEIDGSQVPLLIELLNNGFVCFRANSSPVRLSGATYRLPCKRHYRQRPKRLAAGIHGLPVPDQAENRCSRPITATWFALRRSRVQVPLAPSLFPLSALLPHTIDLWDGGCRNPVVS